MIETKPGIRTTEFWAALAAVIGSVISGLTDMLPAEWSATLAVIATAAYALSRGLAKNGIPAEVDDGDELDDFSDQGELADTKDPE